ncbi:MAG: hypothetical protein PHC68_17885 [Syntrophorhabdaceae bacterium]|nr:hypothetical protein [Syntrophorhabdaceae bacterium]
MMTKDIAKERDCMGRFDDQHNFCLNICCVRHECKIESEKVK